MNFAMTPHVFFCRDSAVRRPDGEIMRIEGWLIGLPAIETVLLQTTAGEWEVVPYGFPRPDVGRAYGTYARGSQSGLRFSGQIACAAGGATTEMRVKTVAASHATPEWHRFDVRLDTSDVQTLALDQSTRLTPDEEQAAAELIAPENLEPRFVRTLKAKRGLTMRLDIINKCNLRCVMCHFSDDAIFKRPTRQLTGEQFKALFDGIGRDVSRVALSCGDEPLTSKFLPDILRYLATEHPHVAIEFCTNAMLMREPIRELLMETRVALLSFSIDAVTKPLLESIRVGCRYEQVIGNILALRDLRTRHRAERPAFVFNYVMMTRNIHEAPAFVRVAKVLGADSIDFRHMVPIPPYFDPEDLLSRYPAKYNFYRERIIAAAREEKLAYYLPEAFATDEEWGPEAQPEVSLADFERVLQTASPLIMPQADPVLSEITAPIDYRGSAAEDFGATYCERPFSEIMIRDQEEVLPCAWHGKTLGRLSEGKTLSEIFHGPAFAALRRNMLKPEGDPDCARCPIKTAHLSTRATRG